MKSWAGCAGITATTRGAGGAPITIPTETCAFAGMPASSNAESAAVLSAILIVVFVSSNSVAGFAYIPKLDSFAGFVRDGCRRRVETISLYFTCTNGGVGSVKESVAR
jgi:hypothetical protein